MTLGEALALYILLPPPRKAIVDTVYEGIRGAFDDINDAFIQAIEDEQLAAETEMTLLGQPSETMVMQ